MSQMRIQQQRQDRTAIDSEDVVAASTAAIVDVAEVQDLNVPTPSTPESVVPSRAGLNDPGGINALAILEAAAETAFETSQRPRPLVTIPTADLISHTSFKAGSKFVLRIVPTQDNASKDKNIRNQVVSDQSLYFDRASLQSTSEVHEERYQLFEAFDSETLFLFGERPKVWSFQFLVTNATRPLVPDALNAAGAEQAREEFLKRWNMDFCDELLRRYDQYYRGTAALKLKARTYMSYEDVLIEATLVGINVARNATIPGAANVGITFVVHTRSFMGASLTFGSDATLAGLLASNDQKALITRQITPTAIVLPLLSPDQLLARYFNNQAATQASQAKATSIRAETAAVTAAGAEAAAQVDELATAQVELDAEIAAETDPEQKAILMSAREDINNQLVTAVGVQMESEAAATARAADLATATTDNNVAINAQKTTEAQLKANPVGDLTQTTETTAYTVNVLTTDDTGARHYKTISAPNSTAASAIASGVDPSVVGGSVTSNVLVDPTDPEFSGQSDNVTTVKERAHT